MRNECADRARRAGDGGRVFPTTAQSGMTGSSPRTVDAGRTLRCLGEHLDALNEGATLELSAARIDEAVANHRGHVAAVLENSLPPARDDTADTL
jgi:hypothetical protein